MYDVFFSYPHTRARQMEAVAGALRARGILVWVDEDAIADFASITRSIVEGLAQAKVLVAFYAAEYARSRACQWELTAAFLAAAREGDPRRRILVINPEPTASHIQPVELRDGLFLAAPPLGDAEALERVAVRVHTHVAALTGSFGSIDPLRQPSWYGAKAIGYSRFVGRLADLWRLHSALQAAELPVITDAAGVSLALVQGMGGVGKSLLAEEYAVRFAAAYGGGVFWLRGVAQDDRTGGLSADEREAERGRQIKDFAVAFGIPVKGRQLAEVEGHLARVLGARGKPYLWIVDDVPSGLERDTLLRWLAPHPLGKTVITTRSREYEALGAVVPLGVLPSDEAYELLTKPPARRAPDGEGEEAAAHAIVERLGGHALAVDVAGAALRRQSFGEFLAALDDPKQDELEFAQDLIGMLPTGHEPSIAATLLRSLDLLGPAGWDFLRLAAVLAPTPIPGTLVQAVFELVDDQDAGASRKRALRAVHETEQLSLAECSDAEPDLQTVHPLIARTVRFHDAQPLRRETLRAAVIAALVRTLPRSAEDSHRYLEPLVRHARELVSTSDDLPGAELREWVGTFDVALGAYAAAEAHWRRQYEVRRRLQGETHQDTLRAMSNLAEMRRAQADLPGARALLEPLLELSRRVLGETHPDTLTALNNLALTIGAGGDLGGARALLERLRGHWQRELGEAHHGTLTVMNNLAEILRRQGDVAAARAILERVCDTAQRSLGERHPLALQAMDNLALTLHAQGDLPAARALQERVVEVSSAVLGSRQLATLRAMGNLAQTLQGQGDLPAARMLETQVVEGHQQQLGESHPDTLNAMNNLASTLRAQGDLTAARALLERVLDLSRLALGDTHPNTSSAAWNSFTLAIETTDAAAARAILQRDLLWLLRAEALDANQQFIKTQLVTLFRPDGGWRSRIRRWLRRWVPAPDRG